MDGYKEQLLVEIPPNIYKDGGKYTFMIPKTEIPCLKKHLVLSVIIPKNLNEEVYCEKLVIPNSFVKDGFDVKSIPEYFLVFELRSEENSSYVIEYEKFNQLDSKSSFVSNKTIITGDTLVINDDEEETSVNSNQEEDSVVEITDLKELEESEDVYSSSTANSGGDIREINPEDIKINTEESKTSNSQNLLEEVKSSASELENDESYEMVIDEESMTRVDENKSEILSDKDDVLISNERSDSNKNLSYSQKSSETEESKLSVGNSEIDYIATNSTLTVEVSQEEDKVDEFNSSMFSLKTVSDEDSNKDEEVNISNAVETDEKVQPFEVLEKQETPSEIFEDQVKSTEESKSLDSDALKTQKSIIDYLENNLSDENKNKEKIDSKDTLMSKSQEITITTSQPSIDSDECTNNVDFSNDIITISTVEHRSDKSEENRIQDKPSESKLDDKIVEESLKLQSEGDIHSELLEEVSVEDDTLEVAYGNDLSVNVRQQTKEMKSDNFSIFEPVKVIDYSIKPQEIQESESSINTDETNNSFKKESDEISMENDKTSKNIESIKIHEILSVSDKSKRYMDATKVNEIDSDNVSIFEPVRVIDYSIKPQEIEETKSSINSEEIENSFEKETEELDINKNKADENIESIKTDETKMNISTEEIRSFASEDDIDDFDTEEKESTRTEEVKDDFETEEKESSKTEEVKDVLTNEEKESSKTEEVIDAIQTEEIESNKTEEIESSETEEVIDAIQTEEIESNKTEEVLDAITAEEIESSKTEEVIDAIQTEEIESSKTKEVEDVLTNEEIESSETEEVLDAITAEEIESSKIEYDIFTEEVVDNVEKDSIVAEEVVDNVEKDSIVAREVIENVKTDEKDSIVAREIIDNVEKDSIVAREIIENVERDSIVAREIIENVERDSIVAREIIENVERDSIVAEEILSDSEKISTAKLNTKEECKITEKFSVVNGENKVEENKASVDSEIVPQGNLELDANSKNSIQKIPEVANDSNSGVPLVLSEEKKNFVRNRRSFNSNDLYIILSKTKFLRAYLEKSTKLVFVDLFFTPEQFRKLDKIKIINVDKDTFVLFDPRRLIDVNEYYYYFSSDSFVNNNFDDDVFNGNVHFRVHVKENFEDIRKHLSVIHLINFFH